MKCLVEYSSSSSEEEEEEEESQSEPDKPKDQQEPSSNKRKLPVPDFLKNKSIKIDDNPEEHQGRLRSIKHERGIWATYLYIPVTLTEPFTNVQKIIMEYARNLNLKLEQFPELHISVTKLLILRHHWIESFVETITTNIKTFPQFDVSFGEIEIYCNDEKTRTFIGIRTVQMECLVKLTETLDKCLEEFKLPKYYEDASFHVSILWVLGDQSEVLKQHKDELQKLCQTYIDEIPHECVTEILCKCGNRLYKYPLR